MPPKQDLVRQENERVGRTILLKEGDHVTCLQCAAGPILQKNLKRHIAPSSDHQKCVELGISLKELQAQRCTRAQLIMVKSEIDCVAMENARIDRKVLVQNGDTVICEQCADDPFHIKSAMAHIQGQMHKHCVEHQITALEYRRRSELMNACGRCDICNAEASMKHLNSEPHKIRARLLAYHENMEGREILRCVGEAPILCRICNIQLPCTLSALENHIGLPDHVDRLNRQRCLKPAINIRRTGQVDDMEKNLDWSIAQGMWNSAQDTLAEQCPRSAVRKFLRMSPEYPHPKSLEPSGPEMKKMCQEQFKAHFTELLPRVCGVCGVLEASREPLAHISLNETSVLKCGEMHVPLEDSEVRIRHIAEVSGTFYSVDPTALCRPNEIPACSNCFESVRSGKVPPFSFRNGWDFGRPIIELGLCPLLLVELSAICRVLHFTTLCEVRHTQKFDANFSRHNISFPSRGPQHLARVLPVCEQRVFVTFVGETTKQKALRCQTFRQKFEVRVDVVTKWLRFLKQHNIFYEDVTISETNLNELRAMGETILSNASTANQPTSVGASLLAHAKNPTSGENAPEENILVFTEEIEGDVSLSLAQNLRQVLKFAENGPPPANEPDNEIGDEDIDPHGPKDETDDESDHRDSESETDHENDTPGPDPYTGDSSHGSYQNKCEGPSHTVPITVTRDAVNEFTENDVLLGGGMPHLFPVLSRESALHLKRPLSTRCLRHLLLHRDSRWAADGNFNFIHFSQIRRHSLSRSVRTRPKMWAKVKELFKTPNLESKLNEALRTPKRFEHRALLRKVSSVVQNVTRHVPFSDASRNSCFSEMVAMHAFMGYPTLYITVSPCDADMKLTLGYLNTSTSPNKYEQLIQELGVRVQAVRDHPAYAAHCFHILLCSIIEHLFGVTLESQLRKSTNSDTEGSGLFGCIKGLYGVVETQGRGSLHHHMLLWGLLPADFVSENVHDSNIRERICRLVSDWSTVSVPWEDRVDKPPLFRPGLQDCPSFDDDVALRRREYLVASTVQQHAHYEGCFKNKDFEPVKCRYAYPRSEADTDNFWLVRRGTAENGSQTYSLTALSGDNVRPFSPQGNTCALGFGYRDVDCRPIVYVPKRHRSDVNTAEYNRLLTSLVGCNTNVVFLGSSCAAAMAMFYLFKYLSKNLLSIASCSGAVHAAKEKEKYQGKGTHANATETLMCNRLGNSQLGLQEVSPQLAAYCCMGYNAEERSHATTYLDVHSAIMLLVHGTIVHEAKDDDSDECDDFTLAVGVGEDGNPEMRCIAIDYYYRGKELSFMSLYLYTATVVKVRKSSAPTNGCSTSGGAGRKRNTTFAFHSAHPESGSFTQRLKSKYTIPSPGHVPRWSHHRETCPKDLVTETMTRQADRHARYFTALHRPFSCECKVPYDRESWKHYLGILRRRAQNEQVLGTDLPPDVCATLVKIINNLRIGINDDAFEEPRKAMNTMRYKCATAYTEWQQKNPHSIAKDVSEATGCDEQEAIEAVNDLLAAQHSHTTEVRRGKKEVSPEVAEYLSALEKEVRIFTRLSANDEKLSAPSECALGQGKSVAHNTFSVYIRPKGQKRFMDLSSEGHRDIVVGVECMNDVDPTEVAHRANQNTYSAVPAVLLNDETTSQIDDALLRARNELQLRPPDKRLDREQEEFVIRCVAETEMRRRSSLAGRGYLAFLHGGPGTGKSETVKCFMSIKRLIRSNSILAFGYSGACAVGVGGTTIHSGFAFPARSRGHTAFDKHLKPERLLALQQRFRDVDTIVLDEASCISTHMLWCIHQRLCMAKGIDTLFGGLSVIMVGDFFQLPPLKTAGASLIYGASCCATSRTMSINDFDFTDLTVQHRAAGTSDDDVAHQQMLKDLRDPERCKSAFEGFLKRAQYTSRMSTPQQCCMLVATNKEREVVSKLQCESYAQRHSLPVAKVQLDRAEYYSVPGKPLMCLKNLSLANKLVNGTLMKEVGLVMPSVVVKNDFLAYVHKNGKPGEVLDCTQFPVYAIRAQTVGVTPTVTCDFRKAEDDELELSCGFAYTVHKVQGATLETDVCVNLIQRPKSYHRKMMTHAAVYVALSRVKRASLLWVLGKRDNKALEYLLDLRPNPDVVAFVAGMKQKCHGTAFLPSKKDGTVRTHGTKRPRSLAAVPGSNSTIAARGTVTARARTESNDDPVKPRDPPPGKRKAQTLTELFKKRANSQAPGVVPKELCSDGLHPEHPNEVNVEECVRHIVTSTGDRIGNSWIQSRSLIPERVIDSVGSLLSMRCREFKVLQVNTLTPWAGTNDVFQRRLESVSLRRIFHTADTIAIPICEQRHYFLYVVRLQFTRDGNTVHAHIRWFDSLPDYCPAARSDHVRRIHQLLRGHIPNIAELDETSATQGSTETQEVNSNDCGLFVCRWLIREAQCCPNRQFLYRDVNPGMTREQLALWLDNTSEAYPGHDSDVPALILLAGQSAAQGGESDILASLEPCNLVDSAVVYRALLQHQDPRCTFRVHHPLSPQAEGTFSGIIQGTNVPHDLSCDYTDIHIWPLFFASHCILCVWSKQSSVIQVYDSLPTYHSKIRDSHVGNLRDFVREHWARDVAVELMTCPVQSPGSNDCAIHTINNGLRCMGVAIQHTRESLRHQWKTVIHWIEKFSDRI